MDNAIARYMQREVLLEKFVWSIAHFSRKEQTPAVLLEICELAKIRNNILFAKDDGIDYRTGMDRLYALAAAE